MTVSLEYDPDSGPQGGISRLRRLASFGRYGADVHPSARTPCSNASVGQRRNSVKECSLLAASLSSFYGWVAKQTGSRVVLGDNSSKCEKKLHVTQQTSAAVKSAAKASTLVPSKQHPCKIASKPAELQPRVQLPSVFTMQGVSANTSCFHSLSYKTSDNQRVHGLGQSPKHVEAASLYLEDFVTPPKGKRGCMSRQPKKTFQSPVAPHPSHHAAAAGSRPVRLHAMPAVKASHPGPCSELHSPPRLISAGPLQLLGPQPDGAKPVAAQSQVPELDLQHLTPHSEMQQPYQQERHHVQHAQQRQYHTQHAQQEWHHAQQECHHTQDAQQEFRQAQHAHQEVHEAQHAKQGWHDTQRAQQECPQTPQTGGSSQSDATHHDHHDSYRSDSTCCDASQSAQADLPQDPALHQPPAADTTSLGEDSIALQHDKGSCLSSACSGSQRPHEALDEHDGLHYNKLASLRGQACHKDVNSDRLTGRQCVPARRAQAVPKRTLANITNTAKAADKKPKAPYGVKNNEGCTAARVPDLVTFWEQRASVQQH